MKINFLINRLARLGIPLWLCAFLGLPFTAPGQTPIVCGQTIATNTSSGAQIDQYVYFGTAGEVLSFALWGPINCYNEDYMVADIYNTSNVFVTRLPALCSGGAALNLT